MVSKSYGSCSGCRNLKKLLATFKSKSHFDLPCGYFCSLRSKNISQGLRSLTHSLPDCALGGHMIKATRKCGFYHMSSRVFKFVALTKNSRPRLAVLSPCGRQNIASPRTTKKQCTGTAFCNVVIQGIGRYTTSIGCRYFNSLRS